MVLAAGSTGPGPAAPGPGPGNSRVTPAGKSGADNSGTIGEVLNDSARGLSRGLAGCLSNDTGRGL
eukprot:212936-Hanusia_phi.AAC.2